MTPTEFYRRARECSRREWPLAVAAADYAELLRCWHAGDPIDWPTINAALWDRISHRC